MDLDDLTPDDFNDPDVEQAWLTAMRQKATTYLRAENVYFRKLEAKPAWHLAPMTSIWAVENREDPGYVGWWAFCGDHPSDYISSSEAGTARDALRVLCAQWHELCQHLRDGREHPTRNVGPRASWPQVVAVLEPRVATFLALTRDKSLWP